MKEKVLNLARSAVQVYLEKGEIMDLPQDLPRGLIKEKAGVFVSLHTKEGKLRGCIGTYLPTKENIAQEIIYNAVAAATKDPRFSPLTSEELPHTKFSVDILGELSPVKDVSHLNPDIYGVLIRSKKNGRSGLLLPDIDGIDTVEKQILVACRKGGIDHGLSQCELFSFTVERFKENE